MVYKEYFTFAAAAASVEVGLLPQLVALGQVGGNVELKWKLFIKYDKKCSLLLVSFIYNS